MASEESIKAGDLVQLISGGPIMTLECIFHDSDQCKCSWFTKGEEKKDGTFYIKGLKKVSEEDQLPIMPQRG